MSKPKIFISHISEEAELAGILKKHFTNEFLNMIEVFVSSDSMSIPVGNRWLDEIDRALKEAQIQIILCSRQSVGRPWINFEAGAGWIRGIPVVPICHSGLAPSDLPIPLSMLQAIKANEIPGLQRLYILLANTLEATIPTVDFSVIVNEVLDFERKYGETPTITGQDISTVRESSSKEDAISKNQSSDGLDEAPQYKGLVEGQKAAQELIGIISKIVAEINKSVGKVNNKLEQYGATKGQDHKIAQQIAYELTSGSGRIEALLPELEGNVNDVREFLSNYTDWLLEKPEKDRNELLNFREQISGMIEGLKTPLEQIRSHRNSMHNLRILSGEVKRASDRMAKALDRIIEPWEEVGKVGIKNLQLIDVELSGGDELPGSQ